MSGMLRGRPIGYERNVVSQRGFDLIGYSETCGTVKIADYQCSEGKTYSDALDGLDRVAPYYEAVWIVATDVIYMRETLKCVNRTPGSISSATSTQTGAKVSRPAFAAMRRFLSWLPPESLISFSRRLTSRRKPGM